MHNAEINKNPKKWFALYVASRQEKNTGRLLSEKGICSYVPLVKTMRQWSDRKKMVEFPLLNGYVFVNISLPERETVLQTRGIVSFVRVDGRDAVVRQDEIDRLKQLVELGYQMESAGVKRNYREGQRIKIVSGPLRNIEGRVIENKDGRFIEILLESIGQSIRVKLPEEIVIPLADAAVN